MAGGATRFGNEILVSRADADDPPFFVPWMRRMVATSESQLRPLGRAVLTMIVPIG